MKDTVIVNSNNMYFTGCAWSSEYPNAEVMTAGRAVDMLRWLSREAKQQVWAVRNEGYADFEVLGTAEYGCIVEKVYA